jgi:hypothetical protein
MRFYVANPSFNPDQGPQAVENLLTDIGDTIRRCFSHENSTTKSMPENIPHAQKKALLQLKQDKDIVIKPADKNMGLCIVDKTWYVQECERNLLDTATYKHVDSPQEQILRSVEHQLQHLIHRYSCLGILPEHIRKFLDSDLKNLHDFPHMYLVPKVHKLVKPTDQLTGRPIVPGHSWITTAASKYVASIRNEVAKGCEQLLSDSRELIRQLNGMRVSRDVVLMAFDVDSLFPNVDIEEAINTCAEMAPPKFKYLVQDFLECIMKNNYFKCIGKLWLSIFGTAQGSPCSPPYADLYLVKLENELRSVAAEVWPIFFKRFLDDGFTIFQSECNALGWLQRYNNLRPRIHLKHVISTVKIDFMDLVIIKDLRIPGDTVPLYVTTYQKMMNKYLYLPFTSHHPRHVFSGIIVGELIRYVVTNTHESDYLCMVEKFWERLSKRGYPRHLFEMCTRRVQHSRREEYLFHQKQDAKPFQVGFYTQYTQLHTSPDVNLTVLLKEVLLKYWNEDKVKDIFPTGRIPVVYKKGRSLGSYLVSAKHGHDTG